MKKNKKAQGISLNTLVIATIALIVLVILICIFTKIISYDEVVGYSDVCNKIDFYPPFEEREDRIEQELKEIFNHNLWVDCSTKEGNLFQKKEGDLLECKMNCYAYHYTEYYYTPLYFWFEFNYTDYKKWKEESPENLVLSDTHN